MKYLLVGIFFIAAFTGFSQSDTSIVYKTFEVVELKKDTTFKSKVYAFGNKNENISSLLTYKTPVFVKYYGNSGLASVSFRGTGASHTKVFWNDLQLNSLQNGQIDFNLIPLSLFNQAEINYGGSSLVNGSGGIGGSINLNNKLPKTSSVFINQYVGSFSLLHSIAGASIVKNKFAISLKAFNKQSKNNFPYTNYAAIDLPIEKRKNAGFFQKGISLQSKYAINSKNAIEWNGFYIDANRNLPGVITSTFPADENQKDKIAAINVAYKWFLNNHHQFKWSVGNVYQSLLYSDTSSQIYSSSNFNALQPVFLYKFTPDNSWLIQTNMRYIISTANSDGFSSSQSLFIKSHFLNISKSFKKLTLNSGVRIEWIDDNLSPLMPLFGIHYKMLKNTSLKAQVSQQTNAPNLNDKYWNPGGNPNLLPEDAFQTEFSVLQNLFKNQLKFTATLFYNHVFNWIQWQPDASGYWSAKNLKEVENKGIEFLVESKFNINQLKILTTFNYAFTQSIDKKQTGNYQLIYVPKHKINYTATFKYKNYSLEVSGLWLDKRFISIDNSTFLPAYGLLNCSINKTFDFSTIQILAGGSINNVLNTEYYSIVWMPNPGINYQLNIKFIYKLKSNKNEKKSN